MIYNPTNPDVFGFAITSTERGRNDPPGVRVLGHRVHGCEKGGPEPIATRIVRELVALYLFEPIFNSGGHSVFKPPLDSLLTDLNPVNTFSLTARQMYRIDTWGFSKLYGYDAFIPADIPNLYPQRPFVAVKRPVPKGFCLFAVNGYIAELIDLDLAV